MKLKNFKVAFFHFILLLSLSSCLDENVLNEDCPAQICTTPASFDLTSEMNFEYITESSGSSDTSTIWRTGVKLNIEIKDNLNDGKPCIEFCECSNYQDYNTLPAFTVTLKIYVPSSHNEGNTLIEERDFLISNAEKDCSTRKLAHTITDEYDFIGHSNYIIECLVDSKNNIEETKENNNLSNQLRIEG